MVRSIEKDEPPPVSVARPTRWPSATRAAMSNSPEPMKVFEVGQWISAAPTSRSLTAVFLPGSNLRDCVNWVLRAWTRRHTRDPRLVSAEGTHIRVECPAGSSDPRLIFQLDGEHDPVIAERLSNGHTGRAAIEVTLDRETLPVLLPPAARV